MAVYELSFDAEMSLAKIYEYSLVNFGEARADSYYVSMHETFEMLVDQPNLGRLFHEYRRHEHGSHVVFYQVTD